LDALAKASNITFTTERYGDIARMRLKNQQLILLKPSTYMNLSGNAVKYWKDKEEIAPENILVLVDDIALPFGAIRIKPQGSDAGHNGLKNIAAMLGSDAYPRLRFGIGNDYPRGRQIEYVLGAFSLDQRQQMPTRINIAIEAINDFCLAGIQHAMCNYNNK
jgi:PTH1 family peptidyl-tRNA hydrolase